MSLYKQAQTTIYFKKLAEREEGNQSKENAPKIKQSRVARILSLKNDLVCIKDVANYHDANHSRKVSQKNRTLYAGGETEQPFNVLENMNKDTLGTEQAIICDYSSREWKIPQDPQLQMKIQKLTYMLDGRFRLG